MKVLFHGWGLPPNSDGVGAYMVNMAGALTRAGHEVVLVSGRVAGCPDREETEYGLVYRCYDKAEAGTERVRDRVLSLAREHKVDVIEGSDHGGECASLLRVGRVAPVLIKMHACQALRVLVRSHEQYWWQRLTIGLALWRARRQVAAERYCIENADMLIAPSQRVLDEALKQGLRLPGRRAVVWNPAPAVPDVLRQGDEAPTPVLLFAGRIEIGKGVAFLPRILKAVSAAVPGVVLELAGADSYARGIGSIKEWLLREFGELNGTVRFLGRLGAEDMAAAYRRAWVVLVPSRWDNFPTVVLEAMAHGRAIVASPNGGMPEMLAGTGCPIVDPDGPGFADAVIRLLRDSGLRRRYGAAAAERAVTAYGEAAVVRGYEAFLAGGKG